ncbi:MAG: DUF6279 family lipoprotein [Vibrio sp.]
MLKRALVALLLLGLAGCSSTQYFYNKLDWFAAQYVEHYVSLNDEQDAMLKQSVVKIRNWHRQEQIPAYIKNIDKTLQLKPQDVTPEKIKKEFTLIKDLSVQVAHQVIPELYPLFMSLNQDQADELFAAMDKKYQDDLDEYKDLSEAEKRDKSAKKMEKMLEEWLGDLSVQQQALVSKWSVMRPLIAEDWIKQQQTNLSELKVLWVQRNDSPEFKAKFVDSLLNTEKLYKPEFQQKLDKSETITYDMLSDVIETMSPKQLEHYHDKLHEWRKILVGLQTQPEK